MAPREHDFIDVLEAAPIGAVILDKRDQVLFWNDALLDILGGMQGHEFSLAATAAFFAEPSAFAQAMEVLARTGEVRNLETKLSRADSNEGWASVSMRPITFEGQPATLVWYFDITQNLMRQRALELSQETLLGVLDAAPLAAAVSDGPGRVSYWNNALLDLILTGEDIDPSLAIRNCIENVARSLDLLGDGVPFVLWVGTRQQKWVTAWRTDVLFEGHSSLLYWIHDVTVIRQAEMEAERATHEKSAFLATMSHEIRTPMNGVRTIAELLSGTALTRDQTMMVDTICDSADALVTVINDILDFSKIEAGRLEMDPQPFDFERMIEGILTLLRPKAAEKGLDLLLESEVRLSCYRHGDSMRLRQVLINLLGNAIKFTQQGSVTLHLVERDGMVLFRIIDTGVGISRENIEQLFKPFQQADASTAREFGGTGLGLSICKALCELMGGTVGVESTLGRGSIFWIAVPMPETAERPINRAVTGTLSSAHWVAPDQRIAAEQRAIVLCAEDNPTNRDVLSRVLARLGVCCEMVENGVEALATLDRQRHGLLLTDGHMPEMDGWELTRHIRLMEREGHLDYLPIVALTADAVRGVEERCREIGMDGFVSKPLTISQVEEQILTHLPRAGDLRTPQINQQPATPPASAVAVTEPIEGVLDLADLIDLVGDEEDTLRPMLTAFLESAERLIGDVRAGVAACDRSAILRAAHALKGAARYVGARLLADTASELETASHAAAPDMPALEIRADRLPGLLAQVGAAILAYFDPVLPESASFAALARSLIARAPGLLNNGNAADVKAMLDQCFDRFATIDLRSREDRQIVSQLFEIEERMELEMGMPSLASGQFAAATELSLVQRSEQL